MRRREYIYLEMACHSHPSPRSHPSKSNKITNNFLLLHPSFLFPRESTISLTFESNHHELEIFAIFHDCLICSVKCRFSLVEFFFSWEGYRICWQHTQTYSISIPLETSWRSLYSPCRGRLLSVLSFVVISKRKEKWKDVSNSLSSHEDKSAGATRVWKDVINHFTHTAHWVESNSNFSFCLCNFSCVFFFSPAWEHERMVRTIFMWI